MTNIIKLIVTINIGENFSNPVSKVYAQITLSPNILIDQLNSFCGKVATEIKDGLFQEVALNGRIKDVVSVQVLCDDLALAFVKDVLVSPSKSLKDDISCISEELAYQMKLEVGHSILCNTKFCNQKVIVSSKPSRRK